MTLILRREADLHACLTSTLSEEFQRLLCPDDVNEAVNAVIALAQRASREFCERWNESRSTIQLPPEILAQCFQFLEVPGRVAASAVCRHWHAIALAYPAVWTSLHLWGARTSTFFLEEMLRRSHELPVSLELTLTTSQDVALRGHMSHVRRLACNYAPSKELLSVPAPLLHTLAVTDLHDPVTIPADLGTTNLRSLRAGLTMLPNACPGLQNLQLLTVFFSQRYDIAHVFVLCPRLVELTVTCLDDLAKDATAVFQLLPTSLVSLTVKNGALGPADYSHSLRFWHGRRFERLVLSRPHAIAGLMELFVNSHSSPWAVDLHSAFADTTVTCRTTPARNESSSTFIITVPARSHPQSALRGCEDHLGRLVEITLSAHELFKCMIDGLSLPMVTSITVAIIPNFWPSTMRWLPQHTLTGVVVPALQSLSFRPESRGVPLSKDILDWFFEVLPAQLRNWLKYDACLLLQIALGGYMTPQWASIVDPARFSKLAVELSLPPVRDGRTGH